MNSREMFNSVKTILIVDWPSKEVPEALTMAGFHVVVRGGPGPEDYSEYELSNGEVVTRHVGRQPERADMVYSYRPLSELPEIIATAKNLDARTIWTQSGLAALGIDDPRGCWLPEDELWSARNLVQSAGLNYISQPYIGDVAREVRASRQ